MENVERTQFVVLTGHLDDRPLPDLVRTLRAQRKSGRLQVEYPDAPGSFFFEEGQLVDAQLGSLRGVEALYAALSLRGASFNFNPLVRPPERSIDRQGQKFISDLVEAPRREGLSEIRVAGRELHAPQSVPHELPPAPQNALVRLEPAAAAALTAPLEARLDAVESAIVSASRRFSRERLIYLMVIAFLSGLASITALQVIFTPRESSPAAGVAQTNPKPAAADTPGGAAAADAARTTADAAATTQGAGATARVETGRAAPPQPAGASKKAEPAAKQAQAAPPPAQSAAVPQTDARKAAAQDAPARGGYVVHVLMEVKDGRVAEARVLNPRPGAGAYEALALRMARQRRYPDTFTGGDTWKITVKP
ncbi:MAG TPA: DUF4388 domain-containing protein [Pyrinomonadaceae bacterium]|nr:DUF4388 domain-containing protein [Pyrinomonadaceae bacterium]